MGGPLSKAQPIPEWREVCMRGLWGAERYGLTAEAQRCAENRRKNKTRRPPQRTQRAQRKNKISEERIPVIFLLVFPLRPLRWMPGFVFPAILCASAVKSCLKPSIEPLNLPDIDRRYPCQHFAV